jgi:protein phosphatase
VSVIRLPDRALVVLVGAAGAGKSTFASRHFGSDEVLSSDEFRAMIAGDAGDQGATRLAFKILHREVVRRLGDGRLVVVDATNLERHARRALLLRARSAGVPAIAIVLALPAAIVQGRNAARTQRVVDPAVVDRHLARLAVAIGDGGIAIEGFDALHVVRTASDLDAVTVERIRTEPDRSPTA